MKNTFYFAHDMNTRTDTKIRRLIMKHGYQGYGLFWAIIEDLYNNANALPTDYEGIAYELRTESDTIESIVNDFGLFVFQDGQFGSLSIQRRLDEVAERSAKASQSARKRWDDANAMRRQCNGNAIKEIKERKQTKEINEITLDEFTEKFKPYPGTKDLSYQKLLDKFNAYCKANKLIPTSEIEKLPTAITTLTKQHQANQAIKARDPKHFVPSHKNASTWINNGCWLADIEIPINTNLVIF